MIKLLEIRDIATTISALAIKPTDLNAKEKFILGRVGYKSPENYVFFGELGGELTTDPYKHDGGSTRTMRVAHQHIRDNWDEIESGAVIDVEYILGESESPKESEYNDYSRE